MVCETRVPKHWVLGPSGVWKSTSGTCSDTRTTAATYSLVILDEAELLECGGIWATVNISGKPKGGGSDVRTLVEAIMQSLCRPLLSIFDMALLFIVLTILLRSRRNVQGRWQRAKLFQVKGILKKSSIPNMPKDNFSQPKERILPI